MECLDVCISQEDWEWGRGEEVSSGSMWAEERPTHWGDLSILTWRSVTGESMVIERQGPRGTG